MYVVICHVQYCTERVPIWSWFVIHVLYGTRTTFIPYRCNDEFQFDFIEHTWTINNVATTICSLSLRIHFFLSGVNQLNFVLIAATGCLLKCARLLCFILFTFVQPSLPYVILRFSFRYVQCKREHYDCDETLHVSLDLSGIFGHLCNVHAPRVGFRVILRYPCLKSLLFGT